MEKETSYSNSKIPYENMAARGPESKSVNSLSPAMDYPLYNSSDVLLFRILASLTEVVGFVCICLVGVWTAVYQKGFAWRDNPSLEFNYHPLFMVIGLIYLYGNAILVYRTFPHIRKPILKLAHGVLHLGAFVFAVVAVVAAFDSHNLSSPPRPNMYSLHSWIGLTTVILFAAQHICGLVVFLVPGFPVTLKSKLLPYHVFCGLGIFVMAVATSLMGLTEKLLWTENFSKLPRAAVYSNVLGVFLVLFGIMVVYLVSAKRFKRRALPEETAIMSSDSMN